MGLCVRFLASPLQTFSQYLSRGSRTSCFSKDGVALAQGEQTARPEMASGLSGYSALLSLLQMSVVQVAVCMPWCNGVTAWTRYCPLLSLAVVVRRVAQFGVVLHMLSTSSSLAHFTLCQCPLSGISVSSLYLLSLNLSARNASCEILESLVHCAQTKRNALVPASMHYLPLVLSTPRCVPQVALFLPSCRFPCLLIRAAKRIVHLDARLPTVIDLRGLLRLPRPQAFAVGFLRHLLVWSRRGSSKGSHAKTRLRHVVSRSGWSHSEHDFGVVLDGAGIIDCALLVCAWSAIEPFPCAPMSRREPSSLARACCFTFTGLCA